MPEGNPLIVTPQETTTAVTGIGIAESAQGLAHGISNGDWVEAGLSAAGVGLEVLSMVIDPLGTLASYGVSWLIEHVRPLKEALDWFAGDPPVIQSFSATWGNVAAEVTAVAQEFANQANAGTSGWTGQAADAYRGHTTEAADALQGAGTLAEGISIGVMIMGEVVAFVREFIRDMVGELVGRLIAWALEVAATLGLATPVVVAQATAAISRVVSKVADLVRKLVKTISNVAPRLRKVISKLDEIIAKLAKLMRRSDASAPNAARTSDDLPTTRAPDTTSPSSTTTPSNTTPSSTTTPGSPTRADTPSGSPITSPGGGTTPSATKGPDTTSPNGNKPSNRPDNPADSKTPVEGRWCRNDPVDVISGEVVLSQTDVHLPGVLPLVLRRVHISSYGAGRLFGRSWASTVDQRLEFDERGAVFVADDGMLLVYPRPDSDGTPMLPEVGPRWPLARTSTGFAITQRETGRTLHFTGNDGESLLSAVTDRNGNRIDVGRDATGALISVRHSAGYHVEIATQHGRATELRLRNPHGPDITIARLGYNEAGDLTTVVNSSGRPLTFDYDPAGRMTQWTDRNGEWYRYRYDAFGRCIGNEGSGGFLNGTFSYDTENRTTRFTDALSNTTTYQWDERNNVVAETDPLGHTSRSEHDAFDRLVSRTDPLGRITSYAYDADGNVTTVIRPDGSEVLAEYNEFGQPTVVVESGGAVWRREYDDRGNLTVLVDPAGMSTRYTYDERGRLTSVTDALGRAQQVVSNSAGLVVRAGNGTRLETDIFGRVVTITDPLGGVTRLSWTVEGRLLSRTNPDGGNDRCVYDGEGNLVEYVDAMGNRSRFEYRGMDLPVARTGPDGARLAFGYDADTKLTSVTNPQGLVWRYEYDAAGNLLRETDFNGRTVSYTYNPAGELVSRTNGAGETTTYIRDALGKVVEKRCGAAVTTFTHDAAGRLTGATDGSVTLAFEHDPVGNVLAETVNGRTVRSEYDQVGRRLRRLTPSGAESRWTYDGEDRPLTLTAAGRTIRFGYDAAGREVRRELGAGGVLTQSWDVANQLRVQELRGVAGRPGPRRTYHYRPDGALVGVDDAATGSRRFDLDHAGRVTAVHGHNWSERYAYDPAGSLTTASWPDSPHGSPEARGPREYGGTLIRRAGGVSYRHDAQGRMVERRQRTLSGQLRMWTYSWDADDRLVGLVTPDGTRWSYVYDPLGRRVGKHRLDATGGTVESTVFVWDGMTLAEQAVYPATGGPVATTTWEWEPNSFRPLAQVDRVLAATAPQEWVDERFYAMVTDLVGTPTELVDATGDVAWSAPRTLWGRALAPSTGGPYCALRFPGQYHDQESGLDYNVFRYYDADSGRFASGDPLGLAGGTEPHSYVPNPLEWMDPLGLTPQCVRDMMRSQKIAPDLLDKGVHVNVGELELKIVPTHDGGVTFKPVHPGMVRGNEAAFERAARQVEDAMQYPEFRDWVRKHAAAGLEMSQSVQIPAEGSVSASARSAAMSRHGKGLEFSRLLKALDRM